MTRPLFNGPGKDNYFLQKGYKPRGVIHVGMNDGEEIPWYLLAGYRPILGFEPLPGVYMQSCIDFGAEIDAGILWLENVALGNPTLKQVEKGLMFSIPRNKETLEEATKGASALAELYLSEDFEIGRTVKVPVTSFDVWALMHDINVPDYDLLMVDVQGMELDVLQGFGTYLNDFKYLVVECSEFPFYKGEAPAQEVIDFLKSRGFTQETPTLSHNDILFLKQ